MRGLSSSEKGTERRINHPDIHYNYVKRMMNIYFRLSLASGLNQKLLPATYLTPHTWTLLVHLTTPLNRCASDPLRTRVYSQ